jgi:two-component sensor histidine kinase
MGSTDGMDRQTRKSAARVVLAYALIAALWILFSDRLLGLFPDKGSILAFSTIKGGLFVAVTSLCLYFLVSGELKRRGALEAELRKRLEEKEELLRELHHRVKNNLQIMGSFLDLERELVTDEEDRGIFDDMQARIQTMAIVQEQIYLAGDLGSIDLAAYTESLAREIAGILGSRLMPILDLKPVAIGVNKALTFGLLLAEELGEAMSGGKELQVAIAVKEENGHAILEIRRSGGSPRGSRRGEASREISGQIKEALARQLGGELERGAAGDEASLRLAFPTR